MRHHGVYSVEMGNSEINSKLSSLTTCGATFLLFSLWYFIMLLMPTILSMFASVTEVGKPRDWSQEILKMQGQVSVFALNKELTPIFVSGLCDLTPLLYNLQRAPNFTPHLQG